MSQSLFYWNPFCNKNKWKYSVTEYSCRNPYFIGILSAIRMVFMLLDLDNVAILILLESFLQYLLPMVYCCHCSQSQSLFYWNPFCNKKILIFSKDQKRVAILILLESFLQLNQGLNINYFRKKSQSLFYWNPFCNTHRRITRKW